jgi:hypothetical protein
LRSGVASTDQLLLVRPAPPGRHAHDRAVVALARARAEFGDDDDPQLQF